METPNRQGRRGDAAEAGFTLLVVILLVAVVIITVGVATPRLLTQGRRDLEEEMIWRGEQYARGVKLYFRKHGRFPTTLEALTKPENNLRFMRQAYRDPMNRQDGTWRLIYVAPNGQLIGSLTRTALIQLPTAPAPSGQQGTPPSGTPPAGTPTGDRPGPPQREEGPTPPPEGPVAGEGGEVIGGSIIGVASKVRAASLKSYNGYANYRQWEFIWNPAADAAAAVTPGTPGGQPTPPGQQPPPGQPPPPPPRP